MKNTYSTIQDYDFTKENHAVIAFDLDGTLAESKSAIDNEMVELLTQLLVYKKIAVISGGSLEQYEKQFLSKFKSPNKNLFVIPAGGSSFYAYDHGWQLKYKLSLNKHEKEQIIKSIKEALIESRLEISEKIYGEQIEDRDSEITFSALGQKAPHHIKDVWDTDQSKRNIIIQKLQPMLPNFSIKTGGLTSIDITKKGVDKTVGIHHLAKILDAKITDILYVGDALYPGGNDEVVMNMGIRSILVTKVEETKSVIKELLKAVNRDDGINPITQTAPWGEMRVFEQNKKVATKIISVKKGDELSLQKHKLRNEFWKVLRGNPLVTIGKMIKTSKPGEEFYIKLDTSHQISAPNNKVEVLEITDGEFDDKDIIRLKDKYGRA